METKPTTMKEQQKELIEKAAKRYESDTQHEGLGPAIFIDGAYYILSNPSLFGVGGWVRGNYDKLYEQVQSGKRTACYVDYDIHNDGKPYRDICTIKPGLLEPTARGIGYGGMMDDGRPEVERFVEMCEGLNLEWMPEAAASDKDKEIAALKELLRVANCPELLIENPNLLNTAPTEADKDWAKMQVQKRSKGLHTPNSERST